LWSTVLLEACHVDVNDSYSRKLRERERERPYSYLIGEGPTYKTPTEMRTTQLSAERYAWSKLKC
jgi:hypothetical protein